MIFAIIPNIKYLYFIIRLSMALNYVLIIFQFEANVEISFYKKKCLWYCIDRN